MYIVLSLVLLIIIFICLIFTKPVKISFLLDSDKIDMHVSMTWLPLLKIEAKTIHLRAHISVYIFSKKIISKFIKKRRGVDKSVLKALSLQNTCIRTFYGLNEPHLTGMLYGAIGFISSLIEIEALEQFPEFVPINEYLRIEANSKLNVGKTIVNLIQIKFEKSKGRKNYGSVKLN